MKAIIHILVGLLGTRYAKLVTCLLIALLIGYYVVDQYILDLTPEMGNHYNRNQEEIRRELKIIMAQLSIVYTNSQYACSGSRPDE